VTEAPAATREAALVGHPRHLALGAAAAGLALAPAPLEAALVAAAALAAIGALATSALPRIAPLARSAVPRTGALATSRLPRIAPRAAIGALAPGALSRIALLAAGALLAGAFAGDARLASIDSAGGDLLRGDRVEGRAHLLGAPRPGPFGQSVEVRMASGTARGARLLARLPRDGGLPAEAGPGLELALTGTLRTVARPSRDSARGPPSAAPPPAPAAAPRPHRGRPFDLRAHLRRKAIAAELAVERALPTGGRRGGIPGALDGARRRAERGIASGLPAHVAALARGMVLGQDEEIDPAVRDDFRASGLAHVLAVSGQNVMLLAALALPLLAAAGLPSGARIAATVLLIVAYVPLAGAGPSLQRAGVMGAASLVALAASRPASRWYALLLAACVTLALNPRATADPGWQLSFAAVAGILLLGPPLRAALGALPRALAEGVAVTVAATLVTAPLLAHHFGAVSLAALPANVLALPLVAPIMWLGMLRAALGQLAPLAGPPAAAADALGELLGAALEPLVRALSVLASSFAGLPGSQVALPLSSAVSVALAYAALAGGALLTRRLAARTHTHRAPLAATWRRMPRRRRAAAVFALAALAALVLARATAPPLPPRALTVSFLDVGQGDATLIQHPDGSTVLFDGGPPEGRAARLLRRAGVRRLSALVMTHASRDHHGGLAEVVERYPIDLLLDGGDGTADRDFRATAAAAERHGARRIAATAPMTLRAGSLLIQILSPAPRPSGPAPEDPNPRAVVAAVSAGEFDLLLSADAESPSLVPLALPDVEAIKVPHHGSADPGLPEILDRLRPEVAAIEVGASNGYGHPTPSTLAALRAADVDTYRTDRDGTVRLTVAGGEMRVVTERG